MNRAPNKSFGILACAAIVVTTLVVIAGSAKASPREGFVESAKCGAAMTEFYKDNSNYLSLDTKGLVWKGVNETEGDRCGVIAQMGAGFHVLKDGDAGYILFHKIDDAAVSHVKLRFIFAPHPGEPDHFVVVDKALSDMPMQKGQQGYTLAKISKAKIWGDNAGNADLVMCIVEIKGKAEAQVRNFCIKFQKNSVPTNVRLKSVDCSALDSEGNHE